MRNVLRYWGWMGVGFVAGVALLALVGAASAPSVRQADEAQALLWLGVVSADRGEIDRVLAITRRDADARGYDREATLLGYVGYRYIRPRDDLQAVADSFGHLSGYLNDVPDPKAFGTAVGLYERFTDRSTADAAADIFVIMCTFPGFEFDREACWAFRQYRRIVKREPWDSLRDIADQWASGKPYMQFLLEQQRLHP